MITGTSSKKMKNLVADHADYQAKLTPWNFKQCLEYVCDRVAGHLQNTESLGFFRLIGCCGGIPRLPYILNLSFRILDYFVETCSAISFPEPAQVDQVIEASIPTIVTSLISRINALYKVDDWLLYFGKTDGNRRANLKVVLAYAITRRPVTLSTTLPNDGFTIEDVMKEGIIFLDPVDSASGNYHVLIPHILLQLLNVNFKVWPTMNLLVTVVCLIK